MRRTFSPHKTVLEATLAVYGFPPGSLTIVDSISAYCTARRTIEPEDSDSRAAKCLWSEEGFEFILSDRADPSDALVPLFARKFDLRWIRALDAPELFAKHLLLHEIAHALRRELHKRMSHDEIERDCDSWAFRELGFE